MNNLIYAQKYFAAEPLDVPGECCGYASVTTDADDQGDHILPGAFRQTLQEWKKRGKFPPFLWQHQHESPAIGYFTEICEKKRGLWVRAKFFLELPLAQMAYAAIKSGAVEAFSIGFRIRKSRLVGNKREILDLDLREISAVTIPGNRDALIQECKGASPPGSEFLEILESLSRVKTILR